MKSWTQIKGILHSERDLIEKFTFFCKDSMIFEKFMPLKIELFFLNVVLKKEKRKSSKLLQQKKL